VVQQQDQVHRNKSCEPVCLLLAFALLNSGFQIHDSESDIKIFELKSGML
jgi:hypothetical protein